MKARHYVLSAVIGFVATIAIATVLVLVKSSPIPMLRYLDAMINGKGPATHLTIIFAIFSLCTGLFALLTRDRRRAPIIVVIASMMICTGLALIGYQNVQTVVDKKMYPGITINADSDDKTKVKYLTKYAFKLTAIDGFILSAVTAIPNFWLLIALVALSGTNQTKRVESDGPSCGEPEVA